MHRNRLSRRQGWKAAALVTVMAMGLAACGSSSSSTSASGSGQEVVANTTTTVGVPTQTQLKKAYLTLADLPPGWAPGEPGATTTTTAGSDSSSSSNDYICPGARSAFPETSSSEDTSVTFNKGQLGPLVIEALEGVPDASTQFKKASDALSSCVGTTWTSTDSSGQTTFSLTEVSMPKHGDEQVAYRVVGDFDGGSASIDMIVFRQGDVVALLAGITVTSPLGTSQFDGSEFADIVATAASKLSTS